MRLHHRHRRGRRHHSACPGRGVRCQGERKGQVAVVFFGDGAGQAGPFHESLNIASLWQLPVIFVCENNGYAEFTPLSAHTTVERLARHAKTYGIPSSHRRRQRSVRRARRHDQSGATCRAGKGPVFVECLTHRMRGHYEGDPAKYRELSQLAEWKEKDPIARVARALKSRKAISDKDIDSHRKRSAQTLVEKAAEFALPPPGPRQMTAKSISQAY